jgi:hypothetical protein
MMLFLTCAAIGMIPRSFWRAFPTLVKNYTQKASKAASAITSAGEEDNDNDEEEENS